MQVNASAPNRPHGYCDLPNYSTNKSTMVWMTAALNALRESPDDRSHLARKSDTRSHSVPR